MTPGPDRAHVGSASATDQAWAADTLDHHWTDTSRAEDLHEGGTHLLDIVAAVDQLARGLRHDFTVWDALDEALDWWLLEQASHTDGVIDDPPAAPGEYEDLLGSHVARVLDLVAHEADSTVAEVLQQAIRQWTTTMAERFNAGYHWPHPTPRRAFPPPAVER